MRFIRKVFATKILLSGKFSVFVTLVVARGLYLARHLFTLSYIVFDEL